MSDKPKSPNGASPPKQDWLGDQLRELYTSYEEEKLPDDLQNLLDKLDDGKSGNGNNGGEAAH